MDEIRIVGGGILEGRGLDMEGKTIICAFCREQRAFINGDNLQGTDDGPETLRGRDYCSFSCRANAVLLAHIDMRRKHPKTLVAYDVLLGMPTL